MKGPWFTLEEAAQKREVTVSELSYKIEKGEISATAFVTDYPLLAVSISNEAHWLGRATCKYRGHIQLTTALSIALLDGKTAQQGERPLSICDPIGINDWSSECPFRQNAPIAPLCGWKSLAFAADFEEELLFLPAPRLGIPADSIMEQASNWLQVLLSKAPANSAKTIDQMKSYERLIFDRSPRIKPIQLRISHSELFPEKTLKPHSSLSLSGRENQLHTLIARIITDTGITSAKLIWKEISNDYRKDDPVYDHQGIKGSNLDLARFKLVVRFAANRLRHSRMHARRNTALDD